MSCHVQNDEKEELSLAQDYLLVVWKSRDRRNVIRESAIAAISSFRPGTSNLSRRAILH